MRRASEMVGREGGRDGRDGRDGMRWVDGWRSGPNFTGSQQPD